MSAAAGIVAFGACSALGEGEAAFRTAALGEAADRRVERDEELAAAGLRHPYAARARLPLHVPLADGADRATALLEHALAQCAGELDRALPDWRSLRIGAAIGTSSGGMRSFERDGAGTSALSGTYLGPLVDAARPCAFEPCTLVLGACASSALAIGLGRAWLLADRCDVVFCGGFDAVSIFVAAGFECLRATSGPLGPLPFRTARDGLALGEGAAIVALVSRERARLAARVRGWVTGFGASCDALHLTAPDSRGEGLARAAMAALADAGVDASAIGLVSAHGTATKQNDTAEAAALARLELLSSTGVFGFKGTVGHTLGAAGALEVLAAMDAMERGVCPASAGEGPAEAGVRVVDRTEVSGARTALKLSAAFGGANAALVIDGVDPRPTPAPSSLSRVDRGEVRISAAVAATLDDAEPSRLAARTAYSMDRIVRADDLVRLALAAVAALEDQLGGAGALRGAAIVVGHGLATIETNALFLARVRPSDGTRLAARGEPRRFPYTSPNAVVGECAVVFGLTGPAFAVGGGPHGGIEALGAAADLIEAKMAGRVVVVAVDAAGPATEKAAPGTQSGAVALLVSRGSLGGGVAVLESWTTRLESHPGGSPARVARDDLGPMDGHRALLPLSTGDRPRTITAELGWGGRAAATLRWLENER